MDLLSLLKYLDVVWGIILIISILLQARSGGGLGVALGGSGGEAYRSKRGLESLLFNASIISAILLSVTSLGIAILSM